MRLSEVLTSAPSPEADSAAVIAAIGWDPGEALRLFERYCMGERLPRTSGAAALSGAMEPETQPAARRNAVGLMERFAY